MSFNFENQINEDVRISNLKLGQKNIQTPYWILNHTQRKTLIRGLNLISNSIPKIKMNEIVIDFKNQEDIDKILANQRKSDELKSKIIRNSRRESENIFQYRFKDNMKFSQNKLSKLLKIQAETEHLAVLTIPDPIIGKSGLIWEGIMTPIISEASAYIETGNVMTYMPMISLNQPIKVVKRKVQWLLMKKIEAIGFRATGSFHKRLETAMNIIKRRNSNVWVHLFDLAKKYSQISQLHLVPLVGVDTISLKKGYSRKSFSQPSTDTGDFPTPEGISLEIDEVNIDQPQTPSQPQDLFEGRALGFFTGNEQIKNYGHQLNCRCPICQRAHFSAEELIKLLSQQDRRALLHVHENIAFPNELNQIKIATNNNEIESYYKSKSLINLNRERISQRYPFFQEKEKLW
jgi:hypothetical protein